MKVIAYCRVSTGVQDFERQIDDIRSYCLKERYELVQEFAEKESGTIKVRPALSAMMNFVEENVVDYVIVHELSRLGRTSQVLETIDFLNKKKVGLISLHNDMKTLNADKSINTSSQLVISILSSINSYELDTFKYRSVSGIKKSRFDGKVAGSANFPYGYKKGEDKLLIVDDDEASRVRLIFDLYVKGYGTTKICNELNEIAIPTRSMKIRKDYVQPTDQDILDGKGKLKYQFKEKWVDGVVYGMLKNPLYKGFRRYKEKGQNEILLHFPKLEIIKPEIFDKVQRMLQENNNKANKHNKFSYLLDPRKIVCGVCRLNKIERSYFPHKRLNGKDNRYMCLSARYKEQCGNYGISIDKIENLVYYFVLNRIQDKLISELDDKELKKNIEIAENKLELLTKTLKREINKESELLDYLLENIISKEAYISKVKPIQYQQELIRAQITHTEAELVKLKNTYRNHKDIEQLRLNYKEGVKVERIVINKLIDEILITKVNRSVYEYPRPDDKVLYVEIVSGIRVYNFFISQRENFAWDINLQRKVLIK